MSADPSEPPSISKIARLFVGSGGTALWFGCADWSYSAAMAADMIGAGILLIVAFIFGVGTLLLSEEMGAFPKASRHKINVGIISALALISVLLFAWENSHRSGPNPTAQQIAQSLIQQSREKVFSHLKLQLVLETDTSAGQQFHISATNISAETAKLLRVRWRAPGGVVYSDGNFTPDRTIAPQATIDVPGAVISALGVRGKISVDVEYLGDIYGARKQFTSSYTFFVPPTIKTDMPLDPIEVSEGLGSFADSNGSQYTIAALDNAVGTIIVVVPERNPSNQLNSLYFKHDFMELAYQAAEGQVAIEWVFPDGVQKVLSLHTLPTASGDHVICFEWDTSKDMLKLSVDGVWR